MRLRPSIAAAVGLSTLTLYSIVLPGLAEAAVTPAPTPPPTPVHTALAQSDILQLKALGLGSTSLVDAAVGEAKGTVDSQGGKDPRGNTVKAKSFGGGVSLKLAEQGGALDYALQTAPEPGDPLPNYGTSADITALSPLVSAKVLDTMAHSEWNAQAACAPAALVPTSSTAEVASLTVLGGTVPGTAIALPALLSLNGTARAEESITQVQNTSTAADDRTLVATTKATVAGLDLLGGAIKISVSKQPVLVASASGAPGGAGVTYSQPVLTVQVAGQAPQTLDARDSVLDLGNIPGLSSLLGVQLSLGHLGDDNRTVAADGTHASADVSMLHVKISLAPVVGGGLTVLDTNLVHLQASASVPVGGIGCTTDPDGDGLTTAEEGTLGLDPYDPDTDNDGVADGAEDKDGDGLTNLEELRGTPATDPTKADTDGDGLDDQQEVDGHTNPTDPADPGLTLDTDGGGTPDWWEIKLGTDKTNKADDDHDNDGDGIANNAEIHGTPPTDPTKADTDGDGLSDAVEPTLHTDPTKKDSDGNGVADGDEDFDHDTLSNLSEINHVPATDPTKADTDGDGLNDNVEYAIGTDPHEADSDSDGMDDGKEVRWHLDPTDNDQDNLNGPDGDDDFDGDGLTNKAEVDATPPTDPLDKNSPGTTPPAGPVDTDGDGLTDTYEETVTKTDPTKADTDGGTVDDGREVANGTDPNDPSDDLGVVTAPDTDGDHLTDATETAIGTDKTKPDTDGDGLTDFEELVTYGTSPKVADTDGGTVNDGTEVKTNHTNPLDRSDDLPAPDADPDGDGLTNVVEATLGTDPTKADTDGDGLKDGVEVLTTGTNPLKADTDADGLSDGAEVNTYRTKPTTADTDGDGLVDGAEVRTYKTAPLLADTDADGLSDGAEVRGFRLVSKIRMKGPKKAKFKRVVWTVKTNPRSRDTDADGLSDRSEVTGSANRFNRRSTNPLVADTDRDGLKDGQEELRYRTNALNWDTDRGGVSDGREIRRGTNPLRAGRAVKKA